MTTITPAPPSGDVPLPRLSDETAVELYLLVEHLLIEARYGEQVRRHFDSLDRDNLIGPDLDGPRDDSPF